MACIDRVAFVVIDTMNNRVVRTGSFYKTATRNCRDNIKDPECFHIQDLLDSSVMIWIEKPYLFAVLQR